MGVLSALYSFYKLKPDALDFLRLPVKVKAGVIGLLKIKVPWTRIQTEPIIIEISDVYALVATLDNPSFEELVDDELLAAQQRLDQRRKELEEIDFKARKKKAKTKSEEKESYTQSFVAKLTAKIVNNLQLKINKIHFRFEHASSNTDTKSNSFAMGISLKELSIQTRSVTKGLQDQGLDVRSLPVNKNIRVEGFRIYWDSGDTGKVFNGESEFIEQMSQRTPGNEPIVDDYSLTLEAVAYLNGVPEVKKEEPRFKLNCRIHKVSVIGLTSFIF